MNPSDRLVAELRQAAHADVDSIFDSWRTIFENRRTRLTTDAGPARRSAGSHSDPTGDVASTTTPAMRWLDDVAKHMREAQTLKARAEQLVGKPGCAGCGEDIGVRPMKRIDGRPYHADGCHQREHRERARRAVARWN